MSRDQLPCSPQIEAAFLGCLLLRPQNFDLFPVSPGHFYERQHAAIYQSIRALHDAGLAVDAATLATQVDPAALAAIVCSTPTAVNVDHYYSELIRLYQERTVVQTTTLAAQCAAAGQYADCSRLLASLESDATGATLPYAPLADWWVVPPREWLFRDAMALDTVTVISSPGGAGKSFLATGLCASVVTGTTIFQGFEVVGRHDVMYLSGEDDAFEVRRRLDAYHHCYFAEDDYLRESVAQRLHLIAAHARPFLALTDLKNIAETAYFNALMAEVRRIRPRLIVVDTLRKHLGAFSENDNSVVGYLLELCSRLARAAHAAVLVLSHASKQSQDNDKARQQDTRGASAVVDEARSVFVIRKTDHGFKMLHAKSNYSPTGATYDFEFQHSEKHPVCLRQVESKAPPASESIAVVARRVVAYVATTETPIKSGHMTAPRYARRHLAACEVANIDTMGRAMKYALDAGWLRVGKRDGASVYLTDGPPPDRMADDAHTGTALPDDGPFDEFYEEDDDLF